MRLAVIGGKLQGLEITYLGRKAGFEVILIDKNEECLAKNICTKFNCLDILKDTDEVRKIFKTCDVIMPAIENKEVLDKLYEICNELDKKLIYDPLAYEISSSKIESDKLFRKLGVPAPKPYPECDFPILVKPSGLSGSKGVKIINNKNELDKLKIDNSWVIQEYLEGKSYSIEIAGFNNKYKTFQATEIIVDEIYDCKRVVAYTDLSEEKIKKFQTIAQTIASEIGLQGIMDVEIILNNDELKVLEIDARFPSQTPIAVYNSTGENILEYLCTNKTNKLEKEKGVIFQHISFKNNVLKVAGEHIITGAKNLELVADFFGSDEAITNFNDNNEEWVATLIIVEDDVEKSEQKKNKVIENIFKKYKIDMYEDLTPNYYC